MDYDDGKTVKGRKLHALVDVEGLPLRVIVHSAGIQDRDGATLVLDKIRQRFPWLELVWADAGYNALRRRADAPDRRAVHRLAVSRLAPMTAMLHAEGVDVNRKRVQRLMRLMGLAALGPKPRTSKPAPGHRIYPYLLRNLTIERANHVWAADITYSPIGRGFLYRVAIIDWASRAVLAWRLSNTIDVSFCLAALEEALAKFGRPEIFNTDQGSQFTSAAFTGALAEAGVAISMDGRGRWMDNVFIERLWRSLKYEDVYLKGYADGRERRARYRRVDRFLQ